MGRHQIMSLTENNDRRLTLVMQVVSDTED